MNKKFLKLCLASILSLSLNTDLQAQELTPPIHAAQEIAITDNNLSEINSFIEIVQAAYPSVEVEFDEDHRSLAFSRPWKAQPQDIEEVLKFLDSQNWIGLLKSLRISKLSHSVDTLLGILSMTPQLTELRISLELSDHYLGTLGASLPHLPNLQNLDLSYSYISGSAMIHFVAALSQATNSVGASNLQKLMLTNVDFTEMDKEGLDAFAHLLLLLPNLQTLDLECIKITESVMVNLVNAFSQIDGFESLPNLLQLNLGKLNLRTIASEAHHLEDAKYIRASSEKYLGETSTENQQAFAKFLSFMPNLQVLNLKINHLRQTLTTIAPVLTQMPYLQDLGLSGNDLDQSVMTNFVSALSEIADFEGFLNLQKLDLSFSHLETLGEEDEQALIAFLSYMPNLKSLNLSDNNLNNSAILVPILTGLPNLQELDLCDNLLYGSSIAQLAEGLSQIEDFELPNLHALNLSDNTLEANEEGENQALAYFLSLMPNLQELDLNGCRIGSGLVAIAPALAQMANLKDLFLSDNYLDKSTMINFVEALQIDGFTGFSKLNTLWFGDNLDGSTEALAEFLSFMPNLRYLRLDSNYLGECLAILAPSIAQMHNLDVLALLDNHIDGSVMVNFVTALASTEGFEGFPKLKELELYDNRLEGMDENEWQALLTFLSFMPNLQKIELDQANFSGSLPTFIETLFQTGSFAGLPNLTIYDNSNSSRTPHTLELNLRDDTGNEIGHDAAAELREALAAFNPAINVTFN